MSHSSTENEASSSEKKYNGVRRRKWGKWVSEIRVPGTQERLWLGTYATAEAAAVAHDVAFFCLRRPEKVDKLNFPDMLSSYVAQRAVSPRSVQQAASDAGMAVDANYAQRITENTETHVENMKQETDEPRGEYNHGQAQNDGIWWENVGEDNWRTWEAGKQDEHRDHEEDLGISIEDYL
ncbi:hypothetical protein L6164_017292 [Bauhinia variegata]|uniref:Uncharacterized protein n=1 Tax=Bauhinia variegata TaxID=167791 RepID=A0ACB9N7M6_BAUVA|nr:hypothetical protein L6164_017292 [Bauhinia variegata]